MKPVFVYGTLKSSIPVSYNGLKDTEWNFLQKKEATINGDLYLIPNLGFSFPALGEINTGNLVYGELIYIDEYILALLDEIESEGKIYNRIITETTEGEECWVYQWKNLDTLEFKIEHGNFQYKEIKCIQCIPMKYDKDEVSLAYIPGYNLMIDLEQLASLHCSCN